MTLLPTSSRLLAGLGLLLLLPLAQGQEAPPPRPPVDREAMWPAPSAEDWARPCLIRWQRTWEDALAVARESGRPILVCVNMDGEIASEHYAGIRYRQPEIAALYEPYVCVIASVYRHTPRDHDEQGRRIPCPRFGTVTCGEHIAIEPGLYRQFFEGERVAPRHIGVELDGQEMYDKYYAWDTDSVFDAIEGGIAGRPPPPPGPGGDRTLLERVASADSRDREAVETAWQRGDRDLKRRLLEAALAAGDAASVDLLRLAALDADPELNRLALAALAQAGSEGAVDLVNDVLRMPGLEPGERRALVGTLVRIGATSPKARLLAAVHQGLDQGAASVDLGGWRTALSAEGERAEAMASYVQSARLESQDEVLDSQDAAAHVELAEAFLASAYEQFAADAESSRLLLMDARETARQAMELGAAGWRVETVLAISAFYLGDNAEAYARAEAAVAGGEPYDEAGWNAMAVLAIFAQSRQEAIREALRAQADWPPQWLADVHAACQVLLHHPHGTVDQVVAYHDFLRNLGAQGEAASVLEEGLARFPAAPELHERLRRQLLVEHGVEALEPAYEERLAAPDAPAALLWFAGRAAFVSAEFHRRAGRDVQAAAAYDRAIAWFEKDGEAEPGQREAVDEQVALALAGKARLAMEAGDLDRSLEQLLASFARSPGSAATLDGLNLSPADTARTLEARLEDDGRQELLARLREALAALEALDPRLLELPAYEGARPATGRSGWRGRGSRRDAGTPQDGAPQQDATGTTDG